MFPELGHVREVSFRNFSWVVDEIRGHVVGHALGHVVGCRRDWGLTGHDTAAVLRHGSAALASSAEMTKVSPPY